MNDAPDCTPATSSGDEETPQSGTLSCVDVEGDSVTYAKATGPTKGSAIVDPDGDWTYTPLVNRPARTRSRSRPRTGS